MNFPKFEFKCIMTVKLKGKQFLEPRSIRFFERNMIFNFGRTVLPPSFSWRMCMWQASKSHFARNLTAEKRVVGAHQLVKTVKPVTYHIDKGEKTIRSHNERKHTGWFYLFRLSRLATWVGLSNIVLWFLRDNFIQR